MILFLLAFFGGTAQYHAFILIGTHLNNDAPLHGQPIMALESKSVVECSLLCSLLKNCDAVHYNFQPKPKCILYKRSCEEEINEIASDKIPQSTNFLLQNPVLKEFCPVPPSSMYIDNNRCNSAQPSFSSCLEALHTNNLQPGYYNIQPTCSSHCNCVHCSTRGGELMISVGHDTEEAVLMRGGEAPGSVVRHLHYSADMVYMLNLIDNSLSCRQFVSAQCHHVYFVTREGTSWLTGRNNRRLSYWGSGSTTQGGCACGKTGSCYNNNYRCNCDANVHKVLVDDGFMTEKKDLPVTGAFIGDTGDSMEYVYFQAGQLQCQQVM